MPQAPPVSGISELVLEVSDLDAARRFYRDLLGFEETLYGEGRDDRCWYLIGSSARLGLWTPQVGLAGGRGGAHVHFAFQLPREELDPLLDRLRRWRRRGRGADPARRRPGDLRHRPRRQRGRVLDAGHGRVCRGGAPGSGRSPDVGTLPLVVRCGCAGVGTAARIWFPAIEHMTIQRMDHVGIVVDDLAAATAFFVELGLKLQGEGSVEGGWVDRVVGLEGVRSEIAMLETPDGHGRLELSKFHAPSGRHGDRHAPVNTPGIRHVTFAVDDIDAAVASVRARGGELVGEVERYEDIYRLCYVRGPEGIIVELAEQIG